MFSVQKNVDASDLKKDSSFFDRFRGSISMSHISDWVNVFEACAVAAVSSPV